MSNWKDITTSTAKHPYIASFIENEQQRILAELHSNIETILEDMNVNSMEEAYDKFGEYLTTTIFKRMNDFVAQEYENAPLKDKTVITCSFTGADFIRKCYATYCGEPTSSYYAYKDLILKNFTNLNTFPKEVTATMKFIVHDEGLVLGSYIVHDPEVNKLIAGVLREVVSSYLTKEVLSLTAPTEYDQSIVSALDNEIFKTISAPTMVLMSKPVDILNQFANYAHDIKMGTTKRVRAVTIEQVESKLDKLISTIKPLNIENAINNITFN